MEMQIIFNNIGIDLWPFGGLILIVVLVLLRRRKHRWPYLFFFSLFWVYAMAGLDKVFFPLQLNGQYVEVMRQAPIMSFVTLRPFPFGPYGLSAAGLTGLVDNILLTVPLGLLVNFITRLRMRQILWLSIAVGFGIEATQLVISSILRYPYRVVDINDALLNALGVLSGYGLFRGFAWLYLALTRRFGVEQRGLLAYIDIVADQAAGGMIQ